MASLDPPLKRVWTTLPPALKDVLRPALKGAATALRTLVGAQALDHAIGRVSVPHLTKAKLKRSFAQQGEDLILDRILTRVLGRDVREPGIYVDVGAFDAVDHSVTYLLYRRGWSGVVFDPSTRTQRSFRRRRPRDTFVNAVVGAEDGVDVDFFIPAASTGDQSLVSTKYPDDAGGFDKVTHRQVNLNHALSRAGVEKIDVLTIDVEGAELEILETLDFDRFRPSVIAVEIHGNDLARCLESPEARLILKRGYQAVGSAVITQFFVRRDEMASDD
jgi:FkbM family methyltransferase